MNSQYYCGTIVPFFSDATRTVFVIGDVGLVMIMVSSWLWMPSGSVCSHSIDEGMWLGCGSEGRSGHASETLVVLHLWAQGLGEVDEHPPMLS